MTNTIVRRRAQLNPWEEMDRAWNSLIKEARDVPCKPVVRVENEETRVVVNAELPGFGPEDVDIQVKENLLTIQAFKTVEADVEAENMDPEKDEATKEKKTVYEKSFVIPEDLDRDAFDAEMKNGLLTLVLPRKEKPAPLAVKVKG